MTLYMILLGCTPVGRHTEQHDIFFGIGHSLEDLKGEMERFWPEPPKLHIDGWRPVRVVDGYQVHVEEVKHRGEHHHTASGDPADGPRLFFLNLGGYKEHMFEEFHYKFLTVGANKGDAAQAALKTAFYLHTGFPGANSHIDDRYGVDVDEVFEIDDILPEAYRKKYQVVLTRLPEGIPVQEDPLHLGYFKWDKLHGLA